MHVWSFPAATVPFAPEDDDDDDAEDAGEGDAAEDMAESDEEVLVCFQRGMVILVWCGTVDRAYTINRLSPADRRKR